MYFELRFSQIWWSQYFKEFSGIFCCMSNVRCPCKVVIITFKRGGIEVCKILALTLEPGSDSGVCLKGSYISPQYLSRGKCNRSVSWNVCVCFSIAPGAFEVLQGCSG